MASSHIHDKAVIVASGDEIIAGQLLDTNSKWIAERLMARGIVPVEHVTVGDERGAIVEAMRRGAERAPLVVMTGGLGPTEGDLTRQALCEAMGDRLVEDPAARAAITAMLERRGREATERQLRQAQRPSNAVGLPNAFGTAPGLHGMVHNGRGGTSDVVCLPGPPGELRPMWAAEVEPRLRPDASRVMLTRLLHIVGVPEADAVTRLGDLTRRDPPAGSPLVGITASGGVLTLRIRMAGAGSLAEAEAAIDQAEAYARRALGDHVFARAEPGGGGAEFTGTEHLAREVLELLKARGRTLAVVESCTGGGLGELLTRIPGASAAFVGGFIAYANAMKVGLGVNAATLEAHGAVSRETAAEMALAGLSRTGAGHCVAVTGVAGPDGGTPIKPVGTVFIAHAGPAGLVDVRRFLITGDREDVRKRAATSGLAMVYFALAGRAAGEPRLLWEVERAATA